MPGKGSRGRRKFGAIRRLPSGRWQARYLGMDGLQRTAPRTFTTKTDADAWLAVRQVELLRGDWIDPDMGRVTLEAYGTRWIAEHRMGPRTRELYAMLFRLHIEPLLGSRPIGVVTAESVRAWRTELLREGRSEGTVSKAYRLLRAIFNTAVDDGRVRRNPCRVKGADFVISPERPVATVGQVFALAEAIGAQYRTFILTAALTSMRWGELVALRRMDVDLDTGLILVRRSFLEYASRLEVASPKNGRERVVTLPDVLIDELRRHLESVPEDRDALVFTGERGATPRRGNWRGVIDWPAAVEAAGLPEGFRFHDLRHTGNQLVSDSGASTRELMQRMGHSTMRAALIYQHATSARSRTLADRLDALVRAERKEASGGS